MRTTSRRWAAVLVAALAAGAAAIGSTGTAATPGDLYFSEYVEGSAFNKALEIFNGTGSPVNLMAGGYAIDVYANGGTVPVVSVALTGTIASDDVYVVVSNAAGPALLALGDQQGGFAFNGNDAVVLRKGSTILDVIGQIGFDPMLSWGNPPVSTLDTTLRRNGSVTGGDPNGTDAFDPIREWSGYPIDTFDGLGSHTLVHSTGSVNADVTIAAAAACLQLSASAVTFGTLALGAEDRPATPPVTVTNCSGSQGTLLASGTDATASGAHWTLDDTAQTCTGMPPLGIDRYHLLVHPASLSAVSLSSTNKTVQTLAAGTSSLHTLRIYTACPGSNGAGKTMSMQVNYTATG